MGEVARSVQDGWICVYAPEMTRIINVICVTPSQHIKQTSFFPLFKYHLMVKHKGNGPKGGQNMVVKGHYYACLVLFSTASRTFRTISTAGSLFWCVKAV